MDVAGVRDVEWCMIAFCLLPRLLVARLLACSLVCCDCAVGRVSRRACRVARDWCWWKFWLLLIPYSIGIETDQSSAFSRFNQDSFHFLILFWIHLLMMMGPLLEQNFKLWNRTVTMFFFIWRPLSIYSMKNTLIKLRILRTACFRKKI